MKKFEHEVLSYDVSKKGEYEVMQAALKKWGDAGFEVISVVNADNITSTLTVFLKREVDGTLDSKVTAA